MFGAYLTAGVMFTMHTEQWDPVDSVYFWIVTFTTVGFGDIVQDSKIQMDEYMPVLLIYRTFGLALLAGVIDSLVAYAMIKKAEVEEARGQVKALKSPSGCCMCFGRNSPEPLPLPAETPVLKQHTLDSFLAS